MIIRCYISRKGDYKIVKNFLFQVFLFAAIFNITSCKESIVEPQTDKNLLSNGSFEIGNQPSLNGWRTGNEQLAELVNQTPPNGGQWALQLTSDGAPTTGFVKSPVTDVKSGDVVTLSAFVRAADHSGGGGIISLVVGQHSKSISTNDTVWNKISITDTLQLEQSDTLWVVLSSFHSQIVPLKGIFDLVELEKNEN